MTLARETSDSNPLPLRKTHSVKPAHLLLESVSGSPLWSWLHLCDRSRGLLPFCYTGSEVKL